jgi:hypothetical protein
VNRRDSVRIFSSRRSRSLSAESAIPIRFSALTLSSASESRRESDAEAARAAETSAAAERIDASAAGGA